MIIVMKPSAKKEHIDAIVDYIKRNGLETHISKGNEVTIIGVIGDKSKIENENLRLFKDVDKIMPVTESYKLTNRKFHPEPTTIKVGGTSIGPNTLTIMAGPCAIESLDSLIETAQFLKTTGATFLRGGAYKPRTSPYAFQGLEEEGLKYMLEAKKETGLATVCEVISVDSIHTATKYVDMLQIGARNMQNFQLLKEVGITKHPVLLKRGLSATIDEWLNAAEYIIAAGNPNVILCERGIRTFETATRNTLDLSAIPVLREKTHLPIIIDPSHSTGFYKYVPSMSLAGIAAGADGLMIEVHNNPSMALSDGPQSLTFNNFSSLCEKIKPFSILMERHF